MIRVWLLGLCLLLGACGLRTPVPQGVPQLRSQLPLTLLIQRSQASERQDWLLVLQAEGPSLRWSLLDPLGVPLARQLLIEGEWHSDGLLPPNPEARELFAALLFALSTDAALAQSYPGKVWQLTAQGRRLDPQWSISYRTPLEFSLSGADVLYQVRALTAGEP
ncbi:MAG: hypothetical protein Q8R10_11915 [Pseudomonas sp.]|uniref:hypothetical protein n=1 Tax=Pseudomonas sp. TaxID=306 RepID=UPI0027346AA9|nr:hypothetical protein [Pseudomonas sp.]MDP3847115.1 hypothetical protein [Pseudomonas sp.]